MLVDQTSRSPTVVFSPVVKFVRCVASTRLVHRSKPLEGTWQIIAWWETRRILYNFLVGLTGLIVSVLLLLNMLLDDYLFPDHSGEPGSFFVAVIGVLFYGIMANICYTGGWVAELLVRSV